MKFYACAAFLALAASHAAAVTLIGNNPDVNNGGLTTAPGAWIKIGDGPDATVTDDHGISPDDGGDWNIGGMDGSGSSAPYDVSYSQTFNLEPGDYVINLSGWAKAYAAWWSGEDWQWIQEAHIMLLIDGVVVQDMMSSNNTNRDTWKLWSYNGTHSVNSTIEVRLRAVKGNNAYGNGELGAIVFASRFDDITLDVASASTCTNPSSIGGISPETAEFTTDSTFQFITVSGANLDEVTEIQLVGPVTAYGIIETSTQTSTQVRAQFDLANLPVGTYDVVAVRPHTCPSVSKPEAFTIVPGRFANGSFELGDPDDPADLPGWKQIGDTTPVFRKRSSEPVFGTAGPFEGEVYAGNSYGGNGNFHAALVQTFKTTTGLDYQVTGGYFGGVITEPPEGGTNGLAWWELVVVDGASSDINAAGTVIARRERPSGSGGMSFRETFSGNFTAAGQTATIMLKWGHMDGSWSYHLAGWDDLVITPTCHTPFADADRDHDVDQDDFGIWQQCFTGNRGTPQYPETIYSCHCFDRDTVPDGVDFDDLVEFENCRTGPGVPFDPDNPGGCNP